MKKLHSIRYYEKRLAKLERVADSISYAIDDNRSTSEMIHRKAFSYRGIWYAGSYGLENINRYKCHYKAADALLMAGGYADIGKK